MTVPASLSKWAHPPRSNTPCSSSSGPPGACITPSTETCVVVVSFMFHPFSRVQISGLRKFFDAGILTCSFVDISLSVQDKDSRKPCGLSPTERWNQGVYGGLEEIQFP